MKFNQAKSQSQGLSMNVCLFSLFVHEFRKTEKGKQLQILHELQKVYTENKKHDTQLNDFKKAVISESNKKLVIRVRPDQRFQTEVDFAASNMREGLTQQNSLKVHRIENYKIAQRDQNPVAKLDSRINPMECQNSLEGISRNLQLTEPKKPQENTVKTVNVFDNIKIQNKDTKIGGDLIVGSKKQVTNITNNIENNFVRDNSNDNGGQLNDQFDQRTSKESNSESESEKIYESQERQNDDEKNHKKEQGKCDALIVGIKNVHSLNRQAWMDIQKLIQRQQNEQIKPYANKRQRPWEQYEEQGYEDDINSMSMQQQDDGNNNDSDYSSNDSSDD